MIVESSAPGKLVISGEYAVLLGAPALVLALDRRIHVRLAPGTRQWHVIARGYDGECRHPLAALQATTHLPPADPAAMLQHVLGAVGAAGCDLARLPPDLEVEIDSRAGFEAGHKLGIGTSAAVCVALTAAVLARIGVGADPLPMALAAHRRAQGGRGSGLDVAASAIGGLIRFEAGSGQVDARRVTWPAGVAAVAIWTGSSADTPDYIDRFDAWRAGTVPAPLAALVDAAGATAAALPDAGAFMRQLRTFAARLRAFDEAAALGIHSRAHRHLHLLAPDGVVYKPCGAGGGDLGVACAVDASVLAAFVARAVEEGYSPLPLELEQDGVQVSIDR